MNPFSFRPLIASLIFLCALIGSTWLFMRVYRDCGWWVLLRGSEIFWAFGACHNGILKL